MSTAPALADLFDTAGTIDPGPIVDPGPIEPGPGPGTAQTLQQQLEPAPFAFASFTLMPEDRPEPLRRLQHPGHDSAPLRRANELPPCWPD